LLHDMAGLFELQARDKGLRFVFEPPQRWPLAVRADEQRLRQILINLLGNAVKFTARGEVRLSLRYLREMATIEVLDTGPGMSAAELTRVFEPFARGTQQAQAGSQGSGLGLTIAKMLTDLMGGEMTVDSRVGEGSRFSLRLFLPEVREGRRAVPVVDQVFVGYEGPRRSVLVVDNEEADRQLLLQWLQPLGFEVALATHGEEALHLLQAGLRPDVIFMDLAMPGIDGWEALRRLRALALQPQPAVAVVSANAFDQGLDNDLGLPAEDFLVKPVRRQHLLAWLGRRLALSWQSAQPPLTVKQPQPLAGSVWAWPTGLRDEVLAQARLGYYRGLVQALEQLQLRCPAAADEVAQWLSWARSFRFEAVEQAILEKPHAPEPLE
jgi:CheY-like chemotaxis protein/anti-sigma regulatory factor (Ser/Thr protein kinase)